MEDGALDRQGRLRRRRIHSAHNRPTRVIVLGTLALLFVAGALARDHYRPSNGSPDAVTVTRRGDSLMISSEFNGSRLQIEATTKNLATNGGFNLLRTTLGDSLIHDTGDDVAPIRTQIGTVGGNHGFSMTAGFANPDRKTEADLGSVWTDGSREYVLFAIGKRGTLIMGGDYVVSGQGVTSRPVRPSSALTHVSGAVHRGRVSPHGVVTQLYPSTEGVGVTTACDGVPVVSDAQCREVEVKESYEVLDYADLYEQAKSHTGQSYTKLSIDGAVRVESSYRFHANGRTLVSAKVTALAATRLGVNGLVQSIALTGGVDETVMRQMPGVRPIDGYDFKRGVDLSEYTEDELVTADDLVQRAAPPTFSLDRIINRGQTRVGFAVGYVPTGTQAGSQSARSKAAAKNSWDLRSTGKSYPVALPGGQKLEPGDFFEVEGFRTYLTPGQADRVSIAVAAGKDTAQFTDLWWF